MVHGSQYILTDNMCKHSERMVMPISMEHGVQIQIVPARMNDRKVYVIQVITPSNPRWITVGVSETPALALTALCRMVGATDNSQRKEGYICEVQTTNEKSIDSLH